MITLVSTAVCLVTKLCYFFGVRLLLLAFKMGARVVEWYAANICASLHEHTCQLTHDTNI